MPVTIISSAEVDKKLREGIEEATAEVKACKTHLEATQRGFNEAKAALRSAQRELQRFEKIGARVLGAKAMAASA